MRGTHRDSWPTIAIVLLGTFVGIVFLGGITGGMMEGGMMGGGMMGGGMMGFGWLLMVVPILLVVFLLSTILDRNERNETPKEGPPKNEYFGTETPMQILERRYASGEISRKDFYRMKEEIYNR